MPKVGDKLDVYTFSEDGKGLVRQEVVVDHQNPKAGFIHFAPVAGFETQTGFDTGSPVVTKDGKLAGFVGIAGTGTGAFDADGVAQIAPWIDKLVAEK